MAEGNSSLYLVEKICDSKIEKVVGGFKTKFLVKWSSTPPSKTWEPIENVYHLPLLMAEFQEESAKKLRDKVKSTKEELSQKTLGNLPKFPSPGRQVLSALEREKEFVPLGDEVIDDVMCINDQNGISYVTVRFTKSNDIFELRDFVFEYFFPVSACYNMMNQKSRLPNITK